MENTNTTLLIDEREKEEARALTQSFARNDVKSRAYINALGAEVCLKYLKDEKISDEHTYNLHNIRKLLEEFDISDIMLSNIHIDVRVVFDENQIFIPKSHFDYNLTPDIYLVLKLAKDHSNTEFLGFFEPKMINKNNTNGEYYFMEKEKLFSPVDLKNFIKDFQGDTSKGCSDKEVEDAEFLIVSMADHNVSEDDKKKLIGYLKQSADLRDKFIEFESFEMLSYQAVNSIGVDLPVNADEVDLEALSSEQMPEDVAEDIEASNIENLAGAFSDEETSEQPSGDISEVLGGAAVLGAEIAGSAAVSAALSGTGEALDAVENVKGLVDSTSNIVNAAAHVANNVSDAIDMASSIQNMAEKVFKDEDSQDVNNSSVPENSPSAGIENGSVETTESDAEMPVSNSLTFEDIPSLDENNPDSESLNANNSAETANLSDFNLEEDTSNVNLEELSAADSISADGLNELDLNMADLTLPDSVENQTTPAEDSAAASLTGDAEPDIQNAVADNNLDGLDFTGNLDDFLSGMEEETPQASSESDQSMGLSVEEPVFTNSESDDEITFTNNDDYDDIIFENNSDDDYGSASSSTSSSHSSSPSPFGAAGTSRRPSISTVIRTPISEATELTSLEDIQLGNIPPSNIPKNVEDQMETMEMDEFHNLVNSYVPQEIKDESETIDFNSLSTGHAQTQNGGTNDGTEPHSEQELADLDSMPEGRASVEVPVERYEDDEYEEELPDFNELQKTEEKKELGHADNLTSDDFVEDISDMQSVEPAHADDVTSDDFVKDISGMEAPAPAVHSNDVTSDDFVKDIPELEDSAPAHAEDTVSNDFVEDTSLEANTLQTLPEEQETNQLSEDPAGSENLQNNAEDLQELVEPEINFGSEFEGGISMENSGAMFNSNLQVDFSDMAEVGPLNLPEETVNNNMEVTPTIVEQTDSQDNTLDTENNSNVDDLSILDELDEFESSEPSNIENNISEPVINEELNTSVSMQPGGINANTAISDMAENVVNNNISGNSADVSLNVNANIGNVNSIATVAGNDDIPDIEICEESKDDLTNDVSEEQLGVLYSSETPAELNTSELEQTEEDLSTNDEEYAPAKKGNKLMPVFAILAAVVIAGAVVGFLMKNKNSIDAETLIQSSPENEALASPETDNSNILANASVEDDLPTENPEESSSASDNKSETSAANINATSKQVQKEVVKDVKESLKQPAPQKPLNSSKTVTLKKLSWEVPDYLSYSDNIKRYLQTAGKSIKLTLSSDLLLTDEYIYSNQVKVNLKLSKDGNIQSAQIAKSSGSEQVDKIVLQTVKDTLSVVKPPQGEVPTPNYNLALIIYL